MALDPKIAGRILTLYGRRRQDAELTLAARRREIYGRIPRVQEIDGALLQTSVQIARAAFQGQNDPAPMLGATKAHSDALLSERASLLASAGYPETYLTLPVTCRRCMDYGYIGSDPCPCFLENYAREQTKELSSLLDTRGQNFDTFLFAYYSKECDPRYGVSPFENMERIFDDCAEYAHSFGRHSQNLLFFRRAGPGKDLFVQLHRERGGGARLFRGIRHGGPHLEPI